MAVYNVDAINESKKNDSLIDSLEEACDYMMNAVAESGARQKYTDMLEKKVHDNFKKAKDARETGNEEDFKKSLDAAEDAMYKRYKYRSDESMQGKNHPAIERGYKYRWNQDMVDHGEDKLANKKPGSVLAAQEKKKAIKETCLYILSVLDEI